MDVLLQRFQFASDCIGAHHLPQHCLKLIREALSSPPQQTLSQIFPGH
jgi:hypothetical protein